MTEILDHPSLWLWLSFLSAVGTVAVFPITIWMLVENIRHHRAAKRKIERND